MPYITLLAPVAMSLLAGPADAQQRFGAWHVVPSDDDPSVFIAGTASSNGVILREICGSGACVWVLTSQIWCDEGKEQGTLATSEGGTILLELVCLGPQDSRGGYYDTVFKDFESIDHLIRQGQVIGFAMALKDGQFKVTRFQTIGAAEAAGEAARRAGTGRSRPARGVRDERR